MTLKNSYRIEILTNEFRCYELDLLGVSEIHIPGVGNMKLGGIELIYTSRKDRVCGQGIGLKMNKDTAKSCLGWKLLIIKC